MITEEIEDEFHPHSIPYVVTGTFILWVCWLFFNGGSTFVIIPTSSDSPASEVIMMNTILSASMGGIFSVFLKNRIVGTFEETNRYDLGAICNGILAGLVAITGPCANVEPWAALIIGGFGGLMLALSTKLLRKLHIDDPLEATQVHGFGGLTGVLISGLFDKSTGFFYSGSLKQLGVQTVGAVAIITWSVFWSGLYFYMLKRLNKFRVPKIYEIIGMDYIEHGGSDFVLSKGKEGVHHLALE